MVFKVHYITTSVLEKPRLGIKNIHGVALGFVFCDLSASLHSLRTVLAEQVNLITMSCFKAVELSKNFIGFYAFV